MQLIRKWWRLALSIAALLIAAQVGVSFLARAHGVHKYLVGHLERAFGRSVEVRQFNILLLPSLVLDAEQVSIGEDPAFGHEYFLRAEHLTAGLRWRGLLRGHFEFGALSLSRPSLILVRNDEGAWNLERWLPPAKSTLGAGSRFYGPHPQETPSNRLQKIGIDDGRINFKIGNEKLPFAFLGVSGSVEQVASGRWHLQLEAQPWRSGVTLQSAGTLLVRGDVAGTSARLQPAEVHLQWGKVSLADLFRLLRGQDYGVRGVFALEGTAKSVGNDRITGADNMQPGDWSFSAQARATGIHRWDLTERSDNPAANLTLEGRWNAGMRSISAERLVVETARSNLRGSARFTANAAPAWEVRLDSAGVQASDLLTWYRAFDPNVNNAIVAEQFFTGGITLRGWPLEVDEAAFSSLGGEVWIPGLDAPLRIGSLQGGRQRASLNVAPVRIAYAAPEGKEGVALAAAAATVVKRKNFVESKGALEVGFTHDFNSREGSASIDGRVENVEDVLRIMSAFGRPMNRGWELTGPVTAELKYQWDNAAATKVWNGHVDMNKATLQVAGLNQPLQVNKARLDWRDGLRSASVMDVGGFGATWSGQLAQAAIDADGSAKWNFQLHANHLDAADLDRWMGPRARPGWLKRLLAPLLGGAAANSVASELLRHVNAEGELRVDEFTLEKIKFGQVRANGALHDLHLEVHQAEARCAGGRLHAKVRAVFSPRPSYDVAAELDRIDLRQVPSPGNLPERLAGLASGTVHLATQGVGRDELLQHLAGKGEIKVRDVEFHGWDVTASMMDGAPHEGASHWTSGQGTFVVRDRGIVFPGLRLDGASERTLLKGTLSFVQDSDITLQTLTEDQTGSSLPEQGYVLKISGPLELPRVSIERLVAHRPAD